MRIQTKDYASTTFVTGMRAWAAMAVLLIHAGGGGLRGLGPVGNAIADLGRGGVYAFFVISGFSVAASYSHAGGYGRYLFMRFMRLAPLYYLWLLIFGLTLGRSGYWASGLGTPDLAVDILAHLVFVHAFFVNSANSMIGVEWSLSVEMFWYLLLPLLWMLVQRGRGLALFVVSLLFFFWVHAYFRADAKADPRVSLALLWHPFCYFLSYALGVWALDLRDKVAEQDRPKGVLLAFILLIVYACWPPLRLHVDLVLAISLISFLLLVYGSNEDALCRRFFMPRWILVLGTLSYGVYLAHLFVLAQLSGVFVADTRGQVLTFIVVSFGSIALAWLTHVGLEKPVERWAKRFYPLVNKSVSPN